MAAAKPPCYLDTHFPLSATNISFRNGLDDVPEDESVLAVRRAASGG